MIGLQNCFDFPTDVDVSDEAKDLMKRLICSAEVRLGQNGIEDFKNHPWFPTVDWESITTQQAPYIPEVSSPTDTSNFDVDDNDLRQCDTQPPQHNQAFSGLHLPFVGFSFTMDSRISDLGRFAPDRNSKAAVKAVTNLLQGNDAVDGLSKSAYERRIGRLEDEKKELVRKLNDSNRALQKMAHGAPIDKAGDSNKIEQNGATEVRRLQDELNQMRKKNTGN